MSYFCGNNLIVLSEILDNLLAWIYKDNGIAVLAYMKITVIVVMLL